MSGGLQSEQNHDDDDADDSGLTFPSSLGMRALQRGVVSPTGWS